MKNEAGSWWLDAPGALLRCWRGCLRELARCLVAAVCAGCGGGARGGAGPRWPPVMLGVVEAGPWLGHHWASQLWSSAEDRGQRAVQVACSCLQPGYHHRHSVTTSHIVSHNTLSHCHTTHCHTNIGTFVTNIVILALCYTIIITLSHKYCHTALCYTNMTTWYTVSHKHCHTWHKYVISIYKSVSAIQPGP